MSRLEAAEKAVSIIKNIVDVAIAIADARRRAREEKEKSEKKP